ncbi:MAG: hypothetical protein ACR2Q4_02865 [Geminicoccaceae bacterium]
MAPDEVQNPTKTRSNMGPGTKAGILLCGVFTAMLGGLGASWNAGQVGRAIDPHVEQACHREAKTRSPLGHRSIITYGYQEDGPMLGIVRGGHEAQYAPNKWTGVAWTCQINPSSRRVLGFEVQATRGGHRMKAAATAF